MSEGCPFVLEERVRWADVDLVGIMRFSAFTRLVEMAEQELLRAAGLPFSDIFDAPEVWMPRRALTIEYFAPARLDDRLRLVAFVSRMGETSLTLNVDVYAVDGGALVAGAAMTVVCVTAATFTKRPLPNEVRQKLAPFALGLESARALGATGGGR
jgi:acyl-CoA thioester hydrolase